MYRLLKITIGFFLPIFTLLAIIGAAHVFKIVVNQNDPQFKIQGIDAFYNERPYSGFVYKHNSKWRLDRLAFYKNGKMHGTEFVWYGNGHLQSQKNYRNGIPDGPQMGWYQNGKVKSLKHYSDGIANGEQWAWHQDGSVWEYNVIDHGRDIAHKTFTFDGKPFHNYLVNGNSKIGLEGDRFCKPSKSIYF